MSSASIRGISGSSGDDDNSSSNSGNEFLALDDGLYDDSAFEALDIELDDGDSELASLLGLDLSSADDALLANTQTLTMASDPTHAAHHHQQQHVVAHALPLPVAALPPATHITPLLATTSRTLAKKLPRSTTTAKKATNKPNPNKARDERRGEVIYLRKKVSELEARLTTLHAKQIENGSSSSAGSNRTATNSSNSSSALSSNGSTNDAFPVILNVWQDIASRQSEERVKAERENIRLRLVLENQLKIAQSLEKVLNKKAAAKDIAEFVERNNQLCPPTADASDDAVFRQLLQDVEQSFQEIDAVFEANGLAHSESPLSHARVRSDAKRGMFLEVFANKILPFDMQATSDAVWRHFTYAKEHTPFRCYTYSLSKFLHSSEDTVVENFILKLDAKGTVANFRYKQILRRHVEATRTVVVWRAVIEAFEFSDEPITGVRFRERGYVVIKKPRNVAGDHTLLQTCYIFTPNFSEDVASGSDRQRVGAITDFVLASTAANVSSTHQMIENVLLEQALKKRSDRVEGVR